MARGRGRGSAGAEAAGGDASGAAAEGKDPARPKRPLIAYMCFVKMKRAEITAQHPEMGFGEVGKFLGQMWKAMTPGQRKPYTDMAEQDKLRHAAEMEAYEASGGAAKAARAAAGGGSGGGGRGRGRKSKDPARPKKALSAYTCFVKHERAQLTEASPDLPFSEVGRLLGQRWKALSDSERAVYEQMAARDKQRHAAEVASYVPPAAAAPKAGRGRGRAKKDPEAPKRALSAYACFIKQERPKLSKAQPGLPFADGGRILGDRWKGMSDAQRAPFVRQATADRERYDAEMAAWKAR